MKTFNISKGDIGVRPLAFESLGVRGMATYVETDDVKLIIDPGSALGPRFKLRPHEKEYLELHKTRQDILNTAEDVDVLTISHYHFDHFIPNFEDWKFIWSSPKIAEEIYTGKTILTKDIKDNINASQRKRGYMFRKKNEVYAKAIYSADNQEFEFGSTKLIFSKPVYHGAIGTKLGYVLMLTIKTPDSCMIHAPDVQGPMYDEILNYIIDLDPDLLIIGGPPIYIRFKLDEADLTRARSNLVKLVEKIPIIAVDHHLLRDRVYEKYLESAFSLADKVGNKLITASELIGKEPELLEARRRELHRKEPMTKEWYERVEKSGLE